MHGQFGYTNLHECYVQKIDIIHSLILLKQVLIGYKVQRLLLTPLD